MSDLNYWLGFNRVTGIGPAKIQALLAAYGSLERAWTAGEAELRDLGFDSRTLQNLREARETLDLDAYRATLDRAGVHVLTWNSAEYPANLREIPAPPPVIYFKGDWSPSDKWAVAVVGTRRLTAYGRQVAHELVTGLSRSGITVVSGLARGIDAVAHQTAIEHGGRTIGVMGSGLDHVYPPEHRGLYHEIVSGHGAIVTEFALGTEPEAKNFPVRNRLISGLTLGVLVIEANERSGALITARFALEQDRDVFAVPGPIHSPVSKGTNRLIQQGAKLVMSVEDILEELNLQMVEEHVAVAAAVPETPEEAALLSRLSSQPVHVDELCRETGMPTAQVSSTLTLMELKGMVQQVGGMNYVRLREGGATYHLSGERSDVL